MIWGLTESTFTSLHVVLSLIGIGSGLIVLFGLLGGRLRGGWNGLFLLTTVATSVTGFAFPTTRLLPSHVVGIISLLVLAVALLARYPMGLAGAWRRIYVVSAAIALYLNVFVGVTQASVFCLTIDPRTTSTSGASANAASQAAVTARLMSTRTTFSAGP